MAEMTNAIIEARTRAMQMLSDGDRRAAIAAAPNVIGFGRFRTVEQRRGFAPAYPVILPKEPA